MPARTLTGKQKQGNSFIRKRLSLQKYVWELINAKKPQKMLQKPHKVKNIWRVITPIFPPEHPRGTQLPNHVHILQIFSLQWFQSLQVMDQTLQGTKFCLKLNRASPFNKNFNILHNPPAVLGWECSGTWLFFLFFPLGQQGEFSGFISPYADSALSQIPLLHPSCTVSICIVVLRDKID